jgi:hypothetical protein
MFLTLVLTVVFVAQPIAAFQTSYSQRAPLLRPNSLEDCIRLATNQLARWKEVYGVCYTLFLKGNRHGDQNQRISTNSWQSSSSGGLSPGFSQNNQAANSDDYVMTSNAQFRDATTQMTSLFAQKRKSEVEREDTVYDPVALKRDDNNEHDNNNNNIDNTSEEREAEDRMENNEMRRRRSSDDLDRDNYWNNVWRNALYRNRRQHSLSINSALVSLADMLVAKDATRERERQRAFHQQLLSLGR